MGVGLLLFMLLTIGRTSDKSTYIIYIPKVIDENNDFWTSVLKGAETAAKENNVKLEIIAPADETDIEMQKRMIQEAIDKHPNAIAVSPSSQTECLGVLQKVLEAGIKLIYIDSATEEEIEDAKVSTDNVAAGRKMAEPMLPTMTLNSKIAIVNFVKESSTAIDREKGFREGLGKYESQIVDVVYSNSEYTTGYDVTMKMLQERNDIDYLACLNEYSAVGAARAVKELGLQHKICVVGFDNSTEEIQQLEEGVFSAIVVQKAFSMGYLGIENAVKVIKGEPIEHYTDSGSVLITKENMYDEANQELLFPFY